MRLNNDEQKTALANYIHQLMVRKKSSEIAITQILAFRLRARQPLCERFTEMKMPVAFMHGEYDWVTHESADWHIGQGDI